MTHSRREKREPNWRTHIVPRGANLPNFQLALTRLSTPRIFDPGADVTFNYSKYAIRDLMGDSERPQRNFKVG